MSVCACTPEALISIPTGLCLSEFRRETPSRIFFYNCDTELPTGSFDSVGAAMKVLFEAGDIISTPELANWAFEDPTYDELQLSDCNAPQQLIATRAFTVEDRTKIDISTVSPFTDNKYYDYDFWQYITENQVNLRMMIAYCDGNVKPVDQRWTVRAFLNYIRSTQPGGKSTETKQIRFAFQGDPLNLTNKPTFNWIEADISLP